MTDVNFPLSSAGDMDDLPRTLRRERDRQKAAAAVGSHTSGLAATPSSYPASSAMSDELVPAAVKSFEVPFWRLMMFFMKAVLAAIPALILLGVILWFGGFALKTFFPWLVQAEFIIRLPK